MVSLLTSQKAAGILLDFTWVLFLIKSSGNSPRENETIKAKCFITSGSSKAIRP